MNLETCVFCHLPVLEIRGEFQILNSYYLNENDEIYKHKVYGHCHQTCIKESTWGAVWYKKRLEYSRNMGFRVVSITSEYCIIDSGRDLYIYYSDGTKEDLGKNEAYQASGIIHEKYIYNLELDDSNMVATIRKRLAENRSFPLWSLVEHLGITDKVSQVENIKKGLLLPKGKGSSIYPNWLEIQLKHEYSIPQELLDIL